MGQAAEVSDVTTGKARKSLATEKENRLTFGHLFYRYHFKLKKLGKSTPLVEAQIKQLNEIGFVWNSHGCAWETKLEMLEDFRQKHGHCRVPRDFDENPPLSTWVKRQRRLYKAGQVSPYRVARLEEMGFVWDPQGLHGKSTAPKLPEPARSK